MTSCCLGSSQNRIEINEKCVIGTGIASIIMVLPFLISSGIGMYYEHLELHHVTADVFVAQHILCWMLVTFIVFFGCLCNIQVSVKFHRLAQNKKAELLFEPQDYDVTEMSLEKPQSSKTRAVSNSSSSST